MPGSDDVVLHAVHLCSGYGGFELALRLAGIDTRTVAHVERDAYAAATLVARMEDEALDQAPVWDDLATFNGGPFFFRGPRGADSPPGSGGTGCEPTTTTGWSRSGANPDDGRGGGER